MTVLGCVSRQKGCLCNVHSLSITHKLLSGISLHFPLLHTFFQTPFRIHVASGCLWFYTCLSLSQKYRVNLETTLSKQAFDFVLKEQYFIADEASKVVLIDFKPQVMTMMPSINSPLSIWGVSHLPVILPCPPPAQWLMLIDVLAVCTPWRVRTPHNLDARRVLMTPINATASDGHCTECSIL